MVYVSDLLDAVVRSLLAARPLRAEAQRVSLRSWRARLKGTLPTSTTTGHGLESSRRVAKLAACCLLHARVQEQQVMPDDASMFLLQGHVAGHAEYAGDLSQAQLLLVSHVLLALATFLSHAPSCCMLPQVRLHGPHGPGRHGSISRRTARQLTVEAALRVAFGLRRTTSAMGRIVGCSKSYIRGIVFAVAECYLKARQGWVGVLPACAAALHVASSKHSATDCSFCVL